MTDIKKINESSNYFIRISHLHQFAEGLTGGHRYTIVIAGNDYAGFKTKAEAKKHFSSIKEKYKSVTIRKDQGYGALGQFYSKPEIIKGCDVKPYSSYHNFSIHN